MLKLTGVIVKGFIKADKRGGDGEIGDVWQANKMSGKESVKGRGVLRKLRRVIGIETSGC